ncbi:helix-turn-helix domain-containing GNAT family N-acetyltransferase [Rhizobium sp.]|jgi:DNA-binding MarR family transcriptional regulator/GNAT superfamily N-acetyltransferase|uniref:bifunctional helix-turn-helix transcriptional regulator/GNAT family N-acetyltransferase n=1 Tax=Rhizobium sp. TaxID=391 RepID=UPI000E7E71D7|nr:MarR family transcriptional regulator [Rhizobium sp.]
MTVLDEHQLDERRAAAERLREFNRVYTNHIGLLDRSYLGSGYTLTEARVLYEIGDRGLCSPAELCRDLHLDAAYLSRILAAFKKSNLLLIEPNKADRRAKTLQLTAEGEALRTQLGQLSRHEIFEKTSHLSQRELQDLVEASLTAMRLYSPEKCGNAPVVLRPHHPGDMGWIIQSQTRFYVQTYGWNDKFEALVCEVAAKFLTHFNAEREYCWIAERDGKRIGSILIADGGGNIAKLRLLYVDEAARGLGLGGLLVREAIGFARKAGYQRITLWTNDILHSAIAIYRKAGFELAATEPHQQFGKLENGQTWVLNL